MFTFHGLKHFIISFTQSQHQRTLGYHVWLNSFHMFQHL